MQESNFRNSPKGKRELRRLSRIAHERALRAALEKLEAKFSLWRSNQLDSFGLNEAIHTYHQTEQREIWGLYQRGLESAAVSRAVADGLLHEAELSSELLADLSPGIAYFRQL